MQLALAAMALAALCGITLGVLSAIRPGGAVDRVAMVVSYLGVSFPVYWVGLLLILLFAVALRWLPPSGTGGSRIWCCRRSPWGMRSIAFSGADDPGGHAGCVVERLRPHRSRQGAGEAAVILRTASATR